MAEKSLNERLGGVNAIAMVVDRFSNAIVKNPKLNVNPQLKEWNTKGEPEGLKFMRTLWICQAARGIAWITRDNDYVSTPGWVAPCA